MRASDWIREEIKGVKTDDAPQMSSSLKIKQSGKGKLIENSIGYFYNHCNNVYYNGSNVGLFTSAFSWGQGFSIISSNFGNSCALHTARRSIKCNWINDKDEYMSPRTDR